MPTGVARIEDRRVRVRSVVLSNDREVEVTDGGSDDGDDMMATGSSSLYNDVLWDVLEEGETRLAGSNYMASTFLVRRKHVLNLPRLSLRWG